MLLLVRDHVGKTARWEVERRQRCLGLGACSAGRACLGGQVGAEEGFGAAQDEVVDDGTQLTAALCTLRHHLL